MSIPLLGVGLGGGNDVYEDMEDEEEDMKMDDDDDDDDEINVVQEYQPQLKSKGIIITTICNFTEIKIKYFCIKFTNSNNILLRSSM